MSPFPSSLNRVGSVARHASLPVLVAVFPALFHFANNSGLALWSDLWKLIGVFTVVAALTFMGAFLALRGEAIRAANATVILMLFFHTYGLLFTGLRSADAFRVDHFLLLVAYVVIGLQAAMLTGKLPRESSRQVWRGALLVILALSTYNAVRITASTLIRSPAGDDAASLSIAAESLDRESHPDIYFFIFDEMAGFEAMRQYWHSPSVDEFAESLKRRGFYVAEQSHGNSISTLYLMAQRLNYREYPEYERGAIIQYQEDASQARIFQDLSSIGYTTVAFDETRSAFGFPAGPALAVNYLYENPSGRAVTPKLTDLDDFTLMVIRNTMLQPWAAGIGVAVPTGGATGQIAFLPEHKEMIEFTLKEVSQLKDLPAPRFVYVHLMLPHFPFMFQADGTLVSPGGFYDWANYQGNYDYTMSAIGSMIDDILASADPERQPVIIIQSDHGARNSDYGRGNMPNYPGEYKTLIVNALYLPGCEDAGLSQDMNPINTFPIVLNCYFGADMPLLPPNSPQ